VRHIHEAPCILKPAGGGHQMAAACGCEYRGPAWILLATAASIADTVPAVQTRWWWFFRELLLVGVCVCVCVSVSHTDVTPYEVYEVHDMRYIRYMRYMTNTIMNEACEYTIFEVLEYMGWLRLVGSLKT